MRNVTRQHNYVCMASCKTPRIQSETVLYVLVIWPSYQSSIKVAGNSFQYFSRLGVWWVIITTPYLLRPTLWYQQTVQSWGNKSLLILWRNRLPQQQYDLLKTPLILALSAYNSKTSSVTPIFYYRIIISMTRCNFLQSFKKFCEGGSEPP